ncbi:hypothetical protein [Streptomyces sp. NPDC059122]|uniref:hypothetical protein n=1 Tax=Streptomyces sp. NPDC059122 TaxID=3346732 RepID=UPI0036C454CD
MVIPPTPEAPEDRHAPHQPTPDPARQSHRQDHVQDPGRPGQPLPGQRIPHHRQHDLHQPDRHLPLFHAADGTLTLVINDTDHPITIITESDHSPPPADLILAPGERTETRRGDCVQVG